MQQGISTPRKTHANHERGNPCSVDATSPEGLGVKAGIAAYAGLYQAHYAYTQQRDAGIQAVQMAIQIAQIVAFIIASQGIVQVSELSAWMNTFSSGLPWAAQKSIGEALIEGILDELIKENVIGVSSMIHKPDQMYSIIPSENWHGSKPSRS